jgi:putative PIG3 family NAD(P)H quinone oxidoreductase
VEPRAGPGEVLLAVRATAINRADLLQVRGQYPPPPDESAVPGLECAGIVEALGPETFGYKVGDRVMALLAGGGHAEKVAAPIGQLMPIPDNLGFEDAAALPEAAITAWTNLVAEAKLSHGQSVLIVAAVSGVGTFAVQLARELGARVFVAGRDLARLERLRPLGAEVCVELDEELAKNVRTANDGRGVDVVFDMAAGRELGSRLHAVKTGGRYVVIGTLAGRKAEIDLGDLLRRRLRLIGSVLRARSREEKSRLVADFYRFAAERLRDGRLQPLVHRVYPFESIAEAYAQLENGGVFGKLVISMGED